MAATRVYKDNLVDTYGEVTSSEMDTINSGGGLYILEVPRDFQFARNANIYRCTKAFFKTSTKTNPNDYPETVLSDTVTIYTDEEETSSMELDIYSEDYTEHIELKAAFIKGIATINASSIIRTMMSKHFGTATVSQVAECPACYLKYESQGFDELIEETWPRKVLNGVAQIGEQPYLSITAAAFLEDLPAAHIYVGYPWTYVQKAGTTAAATPYADITIPALEVREVRVLTSREDLIENALTSAGITYVIIHTTTCENPFYVRWLNRKGGISYWMFSKRQTRNYTAGNTKLREVVVDDVQTAISNREEYGKEASVSVTFGAGNLTASEVAALRRIATSPIVEWWNGSRWVGITLDSYEEAADAGNNSNDIEFTYNLPAILL